MSSANLLNRVSKLADILPSRRAIVKKSDCFVDLGDAVADELCLPFDYISLEMIYRGLYHFSVAHQKCAGED
jgi:hypothetical protein